MLLLRDPKLINKQYDLIENDKFVNKNNKFAYKDWTGSFSGERKKGKACFGDKDLSSWSGLGRSGHERSQSFGSISHVSGPKLTF